MNIRPATLGDARVVADYNRALAWETEKLRLDPARVRRGVRALLRDPAKDGRVIGQLMITLEWSDWRNGFFWWIQSVYVHPEHRRRGVFQGLFLHVRRLARRKTDVCGLRLYVETHNARALRVYEALSFEHTPYQLLEQTWPRSTR
jgi:GNAT superfamily N-acetyltransferase